MLLAPPLELLVEVLRGQVEEVFRICAEAIDKDTVESSLKGPVRHPDFRRLV